ncbi:MAG TPA: TIGR01777 family oxidoreductase [Marinospirillum sp.]|uniref:TIGR01777 family oxidoreductase n=1 Tax=Marinospirillum sp. TaxID=2183934 RepID=UPI002B45C87E|nr:TIGR01777 family oxidoreductase [Marinospirillum sp.]HKM16291.1 TIGR01777 family oxidoreductase [Marinospirillum sp.]
MRILITGGTGFVGQALCPLLASQGYELVLWTRQLKPRLPKGVTDYVHQLNELEPNSVQAVINLAGAGIADKRWSKERKQQLISSRVKTTEQLVAWIAAQAIRPKVLLSASAVGYYGEQGEQTVTEQTKPVAGFTHDLCAAWETAALAANDLGVRVCLVRTGVVLGQGGGSLAKMLPAFRMGMGGPLGKGKHWFPWIHLDDMANIYAWLLKTERVSGVFNASAPNPVINADFTKALGKALNRPTFFPMPEKVLKLLFGEMAELLLVSDKMLPQRLVEEGFQFAYPQLDTALKNIIKS